MRRVRIYILFCGGIFRDVFASYSEAVLHSHYGGCCKIEHRDRDDY